MAARPSHANRNQEAIRNRQRKEELQKFGAFLKTLTPEQLDAAKLITEANTVKRLSDEAADTISLSRTYFNVGCTLFLAVLLAGVFVAEKDQDQKMKYDLLAYALPLIAGAIAGAGLFVRRITNSAFKWSVAFLIAGFFFYLSAKTYLVVALCDTPGYWAALGLMCFALFRSVDERGAPDSGKHSGTANQGEQAQSAQGEAAAKKKRRHGKAALMIVALLIGSGWSWFLWCNDQIYACKSFMRLFNHEDYCVIERPKAESSEGSSIPRSQPETRVGVPASTHTTGH